MPKDVAPIDIKLEDLKDVVLYLGRDLAGAAIAGSVFSLAGLVDMVTGHPFSPRSGLLEPSCSFAEFQ